MCGRPLFANTVTYSGKTSYSMIVLHGGDHQGLGMAHKQISSKNQPHFSHTTTWQYWLGKTKPKKVFRSIRNAFNKLLQKFKNFLFNGIIYWLTNYVTNCLPAWCRQTRITQLWLRLWAWFFCCSTSLQPERCLLPYRCTCNAFFMDLPRPSFVSHSSLFTIHCTWWLLFVMEIVCSGYFDYKSSF